MDTTLRDGEQTSGISFSPTEKLTISKLLISELSVDRIEIASARVSVGEFHSVNKVCQWARENEYLKKVEVLTFLDEGLSLDWINKAGCKAQNLLTKGSFNHLKNQLGQKPNQHFEKIQKILDKADKNKISTNVYLEDWSNGMKKSKEYVFSLLDFLSKTSVKRVMLPDTLGILTPKQTGNFIDEITSKYPKIHFDFHGHNDYDLGVSNTQLNDPKRGFSFNYDGPLDMRMDNINTKLTAETIINEYDEKELSDIFFYYGEERNSRKIANSIVEFRKKKKIDSTKMLSDIIQKINKYKFKHPATRVFQALRIVINEELNELEEALKISLEILTKNARIVIVAFPGFG